MHYEHALKHLAEGRRVRLAAWARAGEWVCFMPPVVIPEALVNGRTKRFVPTGDLRVGGYYVQRTAEGIWQPGWGASPEEKSDDTWELLPEAS